MHCKEMDPECYQHLLDCGWRSCGKMFYLPLNEKTCCPAITIRTDSRNFSLTKKSHKKIIKHLAKHVGIQVSTDNFVNAFSAILQAGGQTGKFVVRSEPSAFDHESWELYQKYQIGVHKNSPDSLTPERYTSFLCNSSLPPSHSRHQRYFVDGKLVAVGAVEMLPNCLSSVYCFYHPDYAQFSLGTLTALYEIYYARCVMQVPFYYMGYYIRTCPKMTYKAQFSPCFLLLRNSQQWIPFEQAEFNARGGLVNNDSDVSGVEPKHANYQIQHDSNLLELTDVWDCLTIKTQQLIDQFIKHVKNIPFIIK